MTRDIFISGVLALLFHGLVLALPSRQGDIRLPQAGRKPFSLCISHPETPAAPTPREAAPLCDPAPPVVEKVPEIGEPVPQPETVIVEKKERFKKVCEKEDTHVIKKVSEKSPVVESVRSLDHRLRAAEKKTSPGVEGEVAEAVAASAPAETLSMNNGAAAGTQGAGAIRQGDLPGPETVIPARPKYRDNPVPSYPRIARKRGHEGRTLLRVEVLETGRVGGIEIAASSGFDVLDRAALESVKKWDFVPGAKNGKKIRQWVVVPIAFSLK